MAMTGDFLTSYLRLRGWTVQRNEAIMEDCWYHSRLDPILHNWLTEQQAYRCQRHWETVDAEARNPARYMWGEEIARSLGFR